MEHIRCKYIGRNNLGCPHFIDGHSAFCFWHDSQAIKNTPDIKKRLETLIHDGHSLEGFALHRAQLQNINLSHANLTNARLYQADLRGSSLLKANLEGANLNSTNLEDVNLLGVRLENARLEHTRWGGTLLQERLAKEAIKANRIDEAMQFYGEAEEVARYLTNESEKRRQYDVSGRFYQLERVMRRMQMPKFSRERCWSKLLDVMCGYGENAARVIGFSLFISIASAMGYFFLGINSPNGILIFDANHDLEQNLFNFLECLYFSVITFTTTGYGDLSPIGFSRLVATLEAFVGAFAISLFVVVFVRKMTQ